MKKALLAVWGVAFVVAAFQAFAQTAPAGAQAGAGVTFPSLDTNRDGMISRPELDANASMKGRFGMIDTNGNGSISSQEFTTFSGGIEGTGVTGRPSGNLPSGPTSPGLPSGPTTPGNLPSGPTGGTSTGTGNSGSQGGGSPGSGGGGR